MYNNYNEAIFETDCNQPSSCINPLISEISVPEIQRENFQPSPVPKISSITALPLSQSPSILLYLSPPCPSCSCVPTSPQILPKNKQVQICTVCEAECTSAHKCPGASYRYYCRSIGLSVLSQSVPTVNVQIHYVGGCSRQTGLLREAILYSSFGKHRLQCNCTGGCKSNMYKCRKSGRTCNSKCHKFLACHNKTVDSHHRHNIFMIILYKIHIQTT